MSSRLTFGKNRRLRSGERWRTDGRQSLVLPLLKEVYVIGLTPVELEKLITDQLQSRGLINSPDVTIVVNGTSSKKIYVTGKVRKEGPIPFNSRMTVLQALSEAGGPSEYANKKKIYVLRDGKGRLDLPLSLRLHRRPEGATFGAEYPAQGRRQYYSSVKVLGGRFPAHSTRLRPHAISARDHGPWIATVESNKPRGTGPNFEVS